MNIKLFVIHLMNSKITSKMNTEFFPITQFPEVSKDSPEFSVTVLIYDKLDDSDEIFFDLGYYNFYKNTWEILGVLQMNIICWSYITLPDLNTLNFTETFLTD